MASFVNLHTHSEYSLLDGAARIDDLVAKAAGDGQPALAITDHGNLYGALEFHDACRGAGINPVLGMEAYYAPDGRTTRAAVGTGKHTHHLTVLAENQTGWHNLMALSSRAYLEGYYHKPRIDIELLAEHAEGLIVLSGCLGGTICQHLLADDPANALVAATQFRDLLGPDNFFIELMRHGVDDQNKVLPGLVDIADSLGVGVVATTDCHYTHQHDHQAHDALLCVQTGSKIADADRFRFSSQNYYLHTAAEMRALFSDLPQACDNTLAIAERCHVDLSTHTPALPTFALPDTHTTAAGYLCDQVNAGLASRYGDPVPAEVAQRVAYELGVIHDMGFDDYFLVVADLVTHARSVGIRVGPGRGSAAGSVVAYALGIVQIDPLAYGLLFERFLNPGRASMPDIDMDFDTRGREEVINYLHQRYGSDHVAQIATFGRIKARAAVRDAARVLDKPYAVGDRISKAMPPLVQGRDTPLPACFDKIPGHEEGYATAAELRRMRDTDPEVAEVIAVAMGLEGLVRQDGIHAGAVVIGPEPLIRRIPVQAKPTVNDPHPPVVTQFDMDGVERLGLLKMDVLGLRNLDVIDRTIKLLSDGGVDCDVDNLALDDPATFHLLERGDTVGVFQLESAPMRQLLRQLRPDRFEDVAAVVALYRPGPMAQNWHTEYADRKNGRTKVSFVDPALAEVLADTYGLVIFQESLMQIAQVLAGYSLAEADDLRKATAKKKPELIAAHRAKFVDGCVANGRDRVFAEQLFTTLEPFAGYSFNKSHAVAYGLISYQTAYLKANHSAQYLAALISSVADKPDKAQTYLAEAITMGIKVSAPDVNISGIEGLVDSSGGIVLGLEGIRGVGATVAGMIVAARGDAEFTSLDDFCGRIPAAVRNKKVLEHLVYAGALDGFGPRKAVLDAVEAAVATAARRDRDHNSGMMSLFDSDDADIDATHIGAEEFDALRRSMLEREVLGMFVSDHPLQGYEAQMSAVARNHFADVDDPTIEHFSLVGVITAIATRPTRAGAVLTTVDLDGIDGSVKVTMFAKLVEANQGTVAVGQVVHITARRDDRGDANTLVALTAQPIELVGAGEPPQSLAKPPAVPEPVVVHLPAVCADELLRDLHGVVMNHPGNCSFHLVTCDKRTVRLSEQFRVTNSPALQDQLQSLGLQITT